MERGPFFDYSDHAIVRLAKGVMMTLIAAMVVRTIAMMIGSDLYLQLPEDDFYYYAIIANNIVHHGHSTFDGISSTNGYHPLWMAVCILISTITGGIGPFFFILLSLIQGCCAFFLFIILQALGREFFTENQITIPIVLIVTTLALPHLFGGMEAALGIPLFALLLLEVARSSAASDISVHDAIRFGFLSSLLVLARLDAIILVIMIVLGWLMLVRMPLWTVIVRMVAALAGGILLPIYITINALLFGSALPISGHAKQLLLHPGLSTHMLLPFLGTPHMLVMAAAAVAGFALDRLARRRGIPSRLAPSSRFAAAMIVLFPILFLCTHALMSDWLLWPWYTYWQPPLRLLLFGWIVRSIITIIPFRSPRIERALMTAAIILVGVIVTKAFLLTTRTNPDWIYVHARVIAAFARTHPGRYAMGDRAGLTAYMMRKPLLQLEGLVSDGHLLDRIARQSRLNDVLREYGIDYLIVSVYSPIARANGRYRVSIPDPMQAGPRSARMTGEFRAEPLLFYTQIGQCYTYIFAARE